MNTYYKYIAKKILDKNISIAIAESFTGGKISYELSKIPGISKSFKLGIVAYSNNSKIKLLNIKKSKILKFGAVSKEIAIDMAKNLLIKSKCKYCVSTTGIAGPTGNTKNKPVGLVYICLASNKKTLVYKKILKGNRISIQNNATKFVFDILNKNI